MAKFCKSCWGQHGKNGELKSDHKAARRTLSTKFCISKVELNLKSETNGAWWLVLLPELNRHQTNGFTFQQKNNNTSQLEKAGTAFCVTKVQIPICCEWPLVYHVTFFSEFLSESTGDLTKYIYWTRERELQGNRVKGGKGRFIRGNRVNQEEWSSCGFSAHVLSPLPSLQVETTMLLKNEWLRWHPDSKRETWHNLTAPRIFSNWNSAFEYAADNANFFFVLDSAGKEVWAPSATNLSQARSGVTLIRSNAHPPPTLHKIIGKSRAQHPTKPFNAQSIILWKYRKLLVKWQPNEKALRVTDVMVTTDWSLKREHGTSPHAQRKCPANRLIRRAHLCLNKI